MRLYLPIYILKNLGFAPVNRQVLDRNNCHKGWQFAVGRWQLAVCGLRFAIDRLRWLLDISELPAEIFALAFVVRLRVSTASLLLSIVLTTALDRTTEIPHQSTEQTRR
jgi:hypothetical protein